MISIISSLKEDMERLVKRRNRRVLVPRRISPIQSVLDITLEGRQLEFIPYTARFTVAGFPHTKHTEYAICVKNNLASDQYYGQAIRKIWVSANMPDNSAAQEIQILGHIASTDQSNGVDNSDMAVFEGEMNSVKMAIKFRNVTDAVKDLAEKEAQHAIETHQNPDIKHLFPKLYFVMNLTVPFDTQPSTPVMWDVIGTELMDSAKHIIKDDTFYYQCFLCLQKLHTKGFIHGDAHRSNFMIRRGELFQDQHPKVCMIDQDQIEPLPDASTAENIAMRNYLQILDYQELLYHYNPHCSSFSDNKYIAINLDYESQNLFQFENQFSVFFLPFGFYCHRTAHIQQYSPKKFHGIQQRRKAIQTDLETRVHTKTGDTYWEYLKTLSTAQIDADFGYIFRSIAHMNHLETSIRVQLRRLYQQQTVQPYRQ